MPNPVLQRLVDERQSANEAIDRVLDAANDEERDPSASERELIGRYRSRLSELEPQIGELLELEETREKAADARAALERSVTSTRSRPEGKPAEKADAVEPAGQYRSFAQFARDALIVRYPYIAGAVEPAVRQRSTARLQRAVETVLTSDVPGLIVPMHVEQILEAINKDRPITSSARLVPLTSGSLQYPKITAKPTVAKQATQKTEAGVGTMTVVMASKAADTFISSANFAWQTIQWSSPDALALWFDLAAADYAAKTDAEVAALLAAVDATPIMGVAETIEGWSGAISQAAGQIYAETGRRVDTIYADVATGYSIIGLASAVAPVFLATGAANLASGATPSIGGLQLVISPQMPADTVVVGDSSAVLCAETSGAPVELRAVEPSIGGLEVGIIGAFACELVDANAFKELKTASV